MVVRKQPSGRQAGGTDHLVLLRCRWRSEVGRKETQTVLGMGSSGWEAGTWRRWRWGLAGTQNPSHSCGICRTALGMWQRAELQGRSQTREHTGGLWGEQRNTRSPLFVQCTQPTVLK